MTVMQSSFYQQAARLLPLLGVSYPTSAFPTTVLCPICREDNQLVLIINPDTQGEWGYCRKCRFTGDMIQLAGQVWKMGVTETVQRIQAYTEPGQFDEQAASVYCFRHLPQKERMQAFWKNCQHTYMTSTKTGLKILQNRLGVVSATPDWESRITQFLGASTRQDVDKTFEPIKTANWKEIKSPRSGTFPSKTFYGRGWHDLLVVPFYDLPGHLSGFGFLGRELQLPADLIHAPAVAYGTPGVAMLDTLLTGAHRQFGETQFFFTDLDIALRFHIRNSREYFQSLPLAAIQDTQQPTRVWEWLHPREAVFWGTDMLASIRQAKLAHGKVSLLRITDTELANHMRNFSPLEWLQKMNAAAVPWVSALQQYVLQLDLLASEDVLSSLGFVDDALKHFIQGAHPKVQKHLQPLLEHRRVTRIRVGNATLVETDEGLFLPAANNLCICDAVIRITRALTTAGATSFYSGTVTFKGTTYPFTTNANNIDKGLLKWARNFLRDECRAGMLSIYVPWNAKALAAVISMSDTQYVTTADRIGWDGKNQDLVFPDFRIRRGQVIPVDYPMPPEITVPARNVKPPQGLTREAIDRLSELTIETQIFWALLAMTCETIIAPAVNRNRRPLLLIGDGAAVLGHAVMTKFGCLVHNYKKKGLFAAPAVENQWPCLGDVALTRHELDWLELAAADRCVFAVAPVIGFLLAMRCRYNTITLLQEIGGLQRLYEVATDVLSNYLQDLSSRNFNIPGGEDLGIGLLKDIYNWFTTIGGNPESVAQSFNVLATPQTSLVTHFQESVLLLCRTGHLQIGNADFIEMEQADVVPLPAHNVVWVSREGYAAAVKKQAGIAPDLLRLDGVLKNTAGEEKLPAPAAGWYLPADWWNTEIRKKSR